MEQTAFQIHPEDNVATALSALSPGRVRLLGDARTDGVTAKEEIPSGHKIALRDIARDERAQRTSGRPHRRAKGYCL